MIPELIINVNGKYESFTEITLPESDDDDIIPYTIKLPINDYLRCNLHFILNKKDYPHADKMFIGFLSKSEQEALAYSIANHFCSRLILNTNVNEFKTLFNTPHNQSKNKPPLNKHIYNKNKPTFNKHINQKTKPPFNRGKKKT